MLHAFGFLAADVQNEFARTYLRPAEETPGEDVLAAVDELIGEAGAWLDAEGVDAGDRVFDVFADCRYYRQDIQIPCALESHGAAQRVRRAAARRVRGRAPAPLRLRPRGQVEIATLRVVGRGTSRDVELKARRQGGRRGRHRPPRAGALRRRVARHADLRARRSSRPATGSRGRRSSSRRTARPSSSPARPVRSTTPATITAGDRADGHDRDDRAPRLRPRARHRPGHARHHREHAVQRSLRDGPRAGDDRGQPVIREQSDQFPLIADRHARMVIGQFGSAIPTILEHSPYAVADLRDGDVIALNDPYMCDGSVSHTPDLLLLRPIFFEGDLVGYSSQWGNLIDVGGTAAGGRCRSARRASTTRACGCRPSSSTTRASSTRRRCGCSRHNTRAPKEVEADIKAIAAGTAAGAARVRRALRALRQGHLPRGLRRDPGPDALGAHRADPPATCPTARSFDFEDFADDDGLGTGPIKLKMTMWRDGDTLNVDWAGHRRRRCRAR